MFFKIVNGSSCEMIDMAPEISIYDYTQIFGFTFALQRQRTVMSCNFLSLSFPQKMCIVSVILINEVERAMNKIFNWVQHTLTAPSSSTFPPNLSSILYHQVIPVNLLNLCPLPEPTSSRPELYTHSFSCSFIQSVESSQEKTFVDHPIRTQHPDVSMSFS